MSRPTSSKPCSAARHLAKHRRLHALYLFASGQGRRRTEVAQFLGVDRAAIRRWLARYEHGRLAALLDLYVPAGKRKPLSADQLAQFRRALAQPTGFASFDAVRR